MTKVHYNRKRRVSTYSGHWWTSRVLIDVGEEREEGSYHFYLASIVFSIFALDAFLNHVGEHLFRCWTSLERLGPRNKLNLIGERIGIEVDYGAEPWRIVPELMGIRAKIAHGKSTMVEEEKVVPVDLYEQIKHQYLDEKWQNYATKERREGARPLGRDLCDPIQEVRFW